MPDPTPHSPNSRPSSVWAVRAGAAALVIGLLAMAAPLVWAAASAGVGLLALAVLAATGFAAFQALPLALQRLENRLLGLRKAEARANPIEQLQNDCLRREERLQSFRDALSAIGGQIESMGQMIEQRRHADPGHVLDRQARALQRMTAFHEGNVVRLREAQAALEAFRHQVRQKIFEWEFAQAGQVVMAALNPREAEELVQGLLSDEALRSVQTRFNTVFAQLDVEMRAVDAPTRSLLGEGRAVPLDALAMPGASLPRSLK